MEDHAAVEKIIKGGDMVGWDKKGAIKSLKAEKCFICRENKPVHVVVTLHGKKDLHFPCCSKECMEIVSMATAEAHSMHKKKMRKKSAPLISRKTHDI